MRSSIFLSAVLLLIAASASSGQDSLAPELNLFLGRFKACGTAPSRMEKFDSKQFFKGKWYVQGALASNHLLDFSLSRCHTIDSTTDGRKVQALVYAYYPILFSYRSSTYVFDTPEETGKDEVVLATGFKAIWGLYKWVILETDYSNYAVLYSCSLGSGKVLITVSRERKDTSSKQKLIGFSEKVGISGGRFYTDDGLASGCPSKEPSIV